MGLLVVAVGDLGPGPLLGLDLALLLAEVGELGHDAVAALQGLFGHLGEGATGTQTNAGGGHQSAVSPTGFSAH